MKTRILNLVYGLPLILLAACSGQESTNVEPEVTLTDTIPEEVLLLEEQGDVDVTTMEIMSLGSCRTASSGDRTEILMEPLVDGFSSGVGKARVTLVLPDTLQFVKMVYRSQKSSHSDTLNMVYTAMVKKVSGNGSNHVYKTFEFDVNEQDFNGHEVIMAFLAYENNRMIDQVRYLTKPNLNASNSSQVTVKTKAQLENLQEINANCHGLQFSEPFIHSKTPINYLQGAPIKYMSMHVLGVPAGKELDKVVSSTYDANGISVYSFKFHFKTETSNAQPRLYIFDWEVLGNHHAVTDYYELVIPANGGGDKKKVLKAKVNGNPFQEGDE